MGDLDSKSVNQILLGPLFLLNHILASIVPGALLLLLLALKGNVLLRNEWLSPVFGYRTKLAVFLLLGFVLGNILRLPIWWMGGAVKLLPAKYRHKEEALIEKYPAFDT